MSNFGTPPAIPPEFQQYNSYIIDPAWQRRFSIIWASLLGVVILFSLPHFLWAVKQGRAFVGLSGIKQEGWWVLQSSTKDKAAVKGGIVVGSGIGNRKARRMEKGRVVGVLENVVEMGGSLLMWVPPGLGLNIGQICVILIYLVIVLLCIIMDSKLVDNSNRAGFLALAQLPLVFLFATKNSVVSFLLGPGNGYEKLNYVHRWTSRTLFLGATVHGALWIRNHLQYNIQILGSQKETSGVACLGVLCGIVLTSLRPVRKWCYQGFYVAHILAFPAFFITVCYHTIYATPWIYPPIVIYGIDMLMRMMRVRVKDASVEASGDMTIIRVQDCTTNWLPGQHLRVRVFIGGRSVFESHPLTIINAPSSWSCLTGLDGTEESDTILLGARAAGDWTKTLNKYARAPGKAQTPSINSSNGNGSPAASSKFASMDTDTDKDVHVHGEAALPQMPILTMFDGPYGGSSVDFAEYASVLVVVGGSGATFGISVVDSILGRAMVSGVEGVKTRRVRFVWSLRSFGQINWFASFLQRLASVAESIQGLDLQMTIYVTCLCDPESLPQIPNCEIVVNRGRPEAEALVGEFVRPSSESSTTTTRGQVQSKVSSEEDGDIKKHHHHHADSTERYTSSAALEKGERKQLLPWVGLEGGVGVCACGPRSLVREVGNAVAGLRMAGGVGGKGLSGLGDVGFHEEVFDM